MAPCRLSDKAEFELVVNLKAACSLDLALPPLALARAGLVNE
jgi:hypothetical protein